MSQVYVGNALENEGIPIIQIDGDVGSATGSIINLLGTPFGGSSLSFKASGSTVDLYTSDASANTLIGESSGNSSLSGSGNVGFGDLTLNALTSGDTNTVVGQAAGAEITSGTANVIVGSEAANQLKTGNGNLILGIQAGTAYTSSETGNILIQNSGVLGESNVIRIGTQGTGSAEQNECFIAGIVGVTTSNPELVTINSSTGQLGVTSLTPVITAWNDEAVNFNAVNGNGYFVTATSTGTLPAAPVQGSTISFAVDSVAGILTITANTGQKIRVGTALSASAGTCASNKDGDSITLVFRNSDSTWFSIGSPEGTWTVT